MLNLEETQKNNALSDNIPVEYRKDYYCQLNRLIDYFKNAMREIIDYNGGNITLPIGTEMMTNCFGKEFDFNFLGIRENNLYAGDLIFDKETKQVFVLYSENGNKKQQRYTIAHELWHFYQRFDWQFIELFDDILLNSPLPDYLKKQLLEKATDKATAMYLMPNDFFIRKFQEITNERNGIVSMSKAVEELSNEFQTSKQSVIYKLKECGIINFEQSKSLIFIK